MIKRFNVLRYGSINEIRDLADGDDPLDKHERRAVVLNLIDIIYAQQERIAALETRLTICESQAGITGEE